jgi:predicted PurR-regulated permease PerM
VLAIVSRPLYMRLRRWRMSPSLSAALATLAVVLVVLVPLVGLTIMLIDEAATAAPGLQAAARSLTDPNAPFHQWLREHAGSTALANPEFLAEKLKALSAAVAARALGIVGSLLGTIVQVFLVLFTLYYMLRDTERILSGVQDHIPLEREQSSQILRRTNEIISASLYGVLMIAGLQGALGGLAFWVLGVPSPVLWTVLMFFLSMIPMGGSFVIWVPVAIWFLAAGHWVKALILALWGTLVIGMADNILRPRLVGQRTKLHELIVFFSVLGGLQVFGVLGLVVGPVVVAIALALVEVLRQVSATAGNDEKGDEKRDGSVFGLGRAGSD